MRLTISPQVRYICIHNIALHSVLELGARDSKRYFMKPFVPYSWDIKHRQW